MSRDEVDGFGSIFTAEGIGARRDDEQVASGVSRCLLGACNVRKGLAHLFGTHVVAQDER